MLTMDGVGEWATSSYGVGRGKRARAARRDPLPALARHAVLGVHLLHRVQGELGRVQGDGARAVRQPRFADRILDQRGRAASDDGSFKLNMQYFNYLHGLTMTSARLRRAVRRAAAHARVAADAARDGPRGVGPGGDRGDRAAHGAARAPRDGHAEPLSRGRRRAQLRRQRPPAARRAVRAASGSSRPPATPAARSASRWRSTTRCSGTAARILRRATACTARISGPAFDDAEIEACLTRRRRRVRAATPRTSCSIAPRRLLADEKVVGWFQGRMEFGPRALGARSILGDPRSPTMQSVHESEDQVPRELPAVRAGVLREHVRDWFELDVRLAVHAAGRAGASRRGACALTPEQERLFGIEKLNVPRSTIPAVTHVDYSARIQTVHAETNPRYHALLARFHALTGCPVLVNTIVQRARRADRLHARGRLSLLHAHGDGRAGHRLVPDREGPSAPRRRRRVVARRAAARLMPRRADRTEAPGAGRRRRRPQPGGATCRRRGDGGRGRAAPPRAASSRCTASP